jgi:glycosyltransferase involved in cell wall biosynthesis
MRPFIRPEARVQLYRPVVRNVFGLSPAPESGAPGPLRLIAIGTVEPRKNLGAAVAILQAIRRDHDPQATLDIVGRAGWGVDAEALARAPGVTFHGYQPAERMRELARAAGMLISTSHDEGLGLPLLEAQYGGLDVVAPDQPVFREVLGGSGCLVRPSEPEAAARLIATRVRDEGWRARARSAAADNIERWNGLARRDRGEVLALLGRLAVRGASAPAAMAVQS